MPNYIYLILIFAHLHKEYLSIVFHKIYFYLSLTIYEAWILHFGQIFNTKSAENNIKQIVDIQVFEAKHIPNNKV